MKRLDIWDVVLPVVLIACFVFILAGLVKIFEVAGKIADPPPELYVGPVIEHRQVVYKSEELNGYIMPDSAYQHWNITKTSEPNYGTGYPLLFNVYVQESDGAERVVVHQYPLETLEIDDGR